jgi:beta-mannanase
MKRLFLALTTLLIFTAANAQISTDTYTVNKTDGTSASYKVVDYPKIGFSSASVFGNYMKGFEDTGMIDTWNVGDVSNVVFNIYHESDVSDITLADKAATDATKRLYKYMKMNYGSKIFSSVMANVDWNHTIADQINTKTGKYPAINCYDFIHIYVPSGNSWINYNDITPVTEWADKGGIVSLMWHFNVPKTETTTIGTDGSGVTCTPSETSFKAANALVSGTWENKYFNQQMDTVASVLLKLQDAGIVALWRPFHEGAGNAGAKNYSGSAWFWWGANGAATYKALWKAMFTYFQGKGIHNLIWEWTTQNYNGDSTAYSNDDDWYPGDDYVDMVGRDLYGYTAAQNKTEYSEITSRYPSKLVALAECGSNGSTAFANISDVWTSGAKWLYFMPWYGSNLPSDAWWTDAMSQSYVITRDKVNVNATTVDESAKEACANMGLGWSLGNTLDAWSTSVTNNQTNTSAYETCWGQPVTTQAMMTFLKKGGLNAVRVPVTWFQHIDSEGNIDSAWMDRVQEVVDYVIKAGMYCILNVHHDTGSGDKQWIKADATNYTTNKAKFEKIWQQIANRFIGYDQHLLFEGYNEMLDTNNSWSAPASGSASYTAINNYAQSFVNAVRNTGGNNATRNLIVNTYGAGSSDVALSNLTIPTDNVSGHIAVEIHTYDPYNWFSNYGQWTSACSTEIKNMFTRLNTRFVSQGIPVIVGEYGTHGTTSVSKTSTTTQIQAAADQAADIVKQAKAYGIATFYWMSIFEGSDRSVPQWTLPTVVDAMVNADK